MPSEVSIDGPEQGLGYRCLIYEWKYALIQSNSDVLVYIQGQRPARLRRELYCGGAACGRTTCVRVIKLI